MFTRVKTLLVAILLLSACATVYPECAKLEQDTEAYDICQEIAADYARTDYIETEFKPWLASCKYQGGFPVYTGVTNRRLLERALDTGNYDGVRRIDLVGFQCASSLAW